VQFTNARTFNTVRELLGGDGVHLEKSRGSASQNVEYCTKEGDYYEHGERPSPGKRSDLDDIRDSILAGQTEQEIANTWFSQWCRYNKAFTRYRTLVHGRDMREQLQVYVLVGDTATGKTRFVYEYAKGTDTRLWLGHDPTLQWFDGYDNDAIACLDDYRGAGNISFLLRLLDKYPMLVPVKGSYVDWRPKVIFITSNVPWTDWYPTADERTTAALRRRFTKIIQMSGEMGDWDATYTQVSIQLALI
jgi:hypothetical protein